MWDVIVVGAGPAGASAALAVLRVRPTATVLLLDRARFPRDKVCGDGIAPHVFDALAEIGVQKTSFDHFGTTEELQLTSPGGAVAARRFARPAKVIRRSDFDAILVDAAVAAGAVLRTHRVRAITRQPNTVTVDGGHTGRMLIGADGAESAVRRAGSAGPPGKTAIALRGYAADPYLDSRQRIVMSERNWPAYAWSFPLADGRTNVGYGELIGSATPGRAELENRLRVLLPEVGPIVELKGHRLPLSSGRPRIADGPILLAGDARALINPLTGEGIYYAVRSGILAGRAAAATLADPAVDAGRAYRRKSARELDGHFRHTTTLATGIGWAPLLEAGVRAAAADQQAFDDLVELGLGAGRITPALVRAVARSAVRR